ncbi:hypothetical protein D3C72_2046350 [compost metagenome]
MLRGQAGNEGHQATRIDGRALGVVLERLCARVVHGLQPRVRGRQLDGADVALDLFSDLGLIHVIHHSVRTAGVMMLNATTCPARVRRMQSTEVTMTAYPHSRCCRQ